MLDTLNKVLSKVQFYTNLTWSDLSDNQAVDA